MFGQNAQQLKIHSRKRADEDPVVVQPPSEFASSKSSDEDVLSYYLSCMTRFLDHKDGAGIISNPTSEGREVEVPWRKMRFESKSKSHQSFTTCVTKTLSNFEIKMLDKVGTKKVLTLARTISINSRHGDWDFLILHGVQHVIHS